MKESDQSGILNPSSGTTVDKGIVSKYKFDFFLASHHGDLGTTRPGHYTVMYDSMNMTKDQIYKMTYELSFLSARCRKPVSLPVPVYYAHLSCEKAKELYKCFKQNTLGEYGSRPSREEIEKHLQTNMRYPGMSFA
uniref:Piwi domain-containing protein n=1 Tax=Caenorhabditis tropicalis TaxID=1561998 RepID=A0A1I7U823_9PELO